MEPVDSLQETAAALNIESGTVPDLTEIPPGQLSNSGRCALYGLFARLLGYPDPDLAVELAGGSWIDEYRQLEELLTYRLKHPKYAADFTPTEVVHLYTALFEVVQGLPAVAMVERRYGQEKAQKQLWEDLLRYYSHFGLQFANVAAEGGPDHLVSELEFMHYLCFLQCGSGDPQGDYQRAQRDFLTHHLGSWTGTFAQRTEQRSAGGVYTLVAGMMAGFVAADLRYLSELCQ